MARVSDSLRGAPTPQAWLRTRFGLELADLVGGDADGGHFAEAGVNAVGDFAGSDDFVDDRAGSVHARRGPQATSDTSRRAECDVVKIFECEVVSVECLSS